MKSCLKKLLIITFVCNLLIVFNFTSVRAKENPNVDFSEIDNYINNAMKDSGIPGISLGIVEGNKIIYLKGYGIADSNKTPVTPQTAFHTGSIAKTLTALAIRQLANEGKIDYDAPVQKYIQWYQEGKRDNSQITINNLINHTSGYSTAQGNADFLYDGRYSIEDVAKKISLIDPDNAIGTAEYSNFNYSILGYVVEKVSGKSYESYIKENILNPLNMKNTFFSDDEASTHPLAIGHRVKFGFLRPYKYKVFPKGAIPAGFYLSNAEDMSHYLIAYLNNGYYYGKSVIPNNTLYDINSSKDLHKNHYSVYWNITNTLGDYAHFGSDNYFYAGLQVSPTLNYGIILFTNARSDGLTPGITAEQITRGVLDILSKGETIALDKTNNFKVYLLYDMLIIFVSIIILFLLFRLINLKKRINKSNRSLIFHVFFYFLANIIFPLSLYLYVKNALKIDFTKTIYRWQLYGLDYDSLILIFLVLFLIIAIIKGVMYLTIRKNKDKNENQKN